jgi:SAM-dependent methyltransferase
MPRACIEAALRWESPDARHCERMHFPALEPERLPGTLADWLRRAAVGEAQAIELGAAGLAGRRDPALVFRIAPEKLRRPLVAGAPLRPRVGRHYPRALLQPLAGCGEHDLAPFRCLAIDASGITVDLNHPLAGCGGVLELTLMGAGGGAPPPPHPVQRLIADGPGMQAALRDVATDFGDEGGYARADDSDDVEFYRRPRLVPHLDATALSRLAAAHRRFLVPGMRVLDLMSSWQSHLPDDVAGLEVTGVGMNAEELAANPRLSHRLVHDLNRDPHLPLDGGFDLALCSLSVEYLVRPAAAFAEVARLLRPGAAFVLSFSQRWFPPKVVRIWTCLHPFERTGLLLAHFHRSGLFARPASESLRGLPRPLHDRYAGRLALSDPLHLVWACRSGHCQMPPTEAI